MTDLSKPERPDHLVRFKSYLLPHNLTLVLAVGVYAETLLRFFYHTSLWDFSNFGALYDFLKNIKPLSAAVAVCGLPILREVSWSLTRTVMSLLPDLPDFFRKEQNKKLIDG